MMIRLIGLYVYTQIFSRKILWHLNSLTCLDKQKSIQHVDAIHLAGESVCNYIHRYKIYA